MVGLLLVLLLLLGNRNGSKKGSSPFVGITTDKRRPLFYLRSQHQVAFVGSPAKLMGNEGLFSHTYDSRNRLQRRARLRLREQEL